MTHMKIQKEVADQLLLSRSLLERLRFQAAPDSDRLSLATHVLTVHDAAELALAAIVSACSIPLSTTRPAMMDYLAALKTRHSDREVTGRDYFDRLNRTRANLKHAGVFPEPKQWASVVETVYSCLSDLCVEYLETSLDELDEAILLTSEAVKQWFYQGREAMSEGKFREVLEYLGRALFCLFQENAGLRYLSVGRADVGAAIKLTGFGVHANDYLALQEFLPEVQEASDGTLKVKWQQGNYGHPGNWREDAATFCLKTFLDVALKIQAAPWIPGAIDFVFLYEHQVAPIWDEVEICRPKKGSLLLPKDKNDRELVRTLRKGEVIRGQVSRHKKTLVEAMIGGLDEEILSIIWGSLAEIGYVEASAVKVTWVPRDNSLVHQYFPNLPELEWEPEESG